MKKYYDAMYKAFNYYHCLLYRNKDISQSIKCRWREELYAELGGVLDVACLDNDVNGDSDFDTLLNLRYNLYDIARVYFLAE